jgi:hypothetical protein
MGLETRNGRSYYYSKLRRGGKVVSVYEGSGHIAQLCALHAEKRRDEEEQRKAKLAPAIAEIDEIDRLLEDTIATGKKALTALYIANGYHTHSRTWRRKRT